MSIRIFLLALSCLASISLAIDPRFEQGARFLSQGEYEKALGEYRSILAEEPQNSEAYFAAAEVYIKMPKPDYSRALANYRLAYKFTPTMSAAYEGAAKVYEILGQKSKADAELAKDPKNKPVETPIEVADETVTSEESTAVVTLEQNKTTELSTNVQQKDTLIKNETQEVSKPLEEKNVQASKVSEQPSVSPNTQTKEATLTTEKKVEEEPKVNGDDSFEKGKALLTQGQYKEASKMWREVLQKKPGDLGAYYYAGITRYYMGEYDKAEFNLKKGIEYKEALAEGYYYLSLVYQKTNQMDLEKKSLATYIKKSKAKGEHQEYAENRLKELKQASIDTSKTEEVIETQKEIPSIKPAKAVAYSTERGIELLKSLAYEEALQVFKVVLESEITPEERYFVLLQMGNIYRELKDFHSASSRYREIIQQYPDSDWALEAERALDDVSWLEKNSSYFPRRR